MDRPSKTDGCDRGENYIGNIMWLETNFYHKNYNRPTYFNN